MYFSENSSDLLEDPYIENQNKLQSEYSPPWLDKTEMLAIEYFENKNINSLSNKIVFFICVDLWKKCIKSEVKNRAANL